MENRDKLIDILIKEIFFARDKTKAFKVIQAIAKDERLSVEDAKGWCYRPDPIRWMSDEELCVLSQHVNQALPNQIRLNEYFSERELKNSQTYAGVSIKRNNMYTFNNVAQMGDNQWSCIISVEQIALLRKAGSVRTDVNLQRDTNVRKVKKSNKGEDVGSDIIRVIRVNPTRVNQIAKLLADGKYFYNTIRFNIMNYNEDEVVIENGVMTIPQDSDIIVLDGNHRTIGCEMAYFDHPELREHFSGQYFNVIVTFLGAEDCRRCISQEWNVEAVSTVRKKTMAVNYANYIVEYIKKSPEAEDIYKREIVSDTGMLKNNIALFDASILAMAIAHVYNTNEIDLKSQADDIARHLIRVYNVAAAVFVNDFKNRRNSLRDKWNLTSMAWAGLVFVAKKLDDKNLERVLKETLKSIDWDRSALKLDIKRKSLKTIVEVGELLCKEVDNHV